MLSSAYLNSFKRSELSVSLSAYYLIRDLEEQVNTFSKDIYIRYPLYLLLLSKAEAAKVAKKKRLEQGENDSKAHWDAPHVILRLVTTTRPQ